MRRCVRPRVARSHAGWRHPLQTLSSTPSSLNSLGVRSLATQRRTIPTTSAASEYEKANVFNRSMYDRDLSEMLPVSRLTTRRLGAEQSDAADLKNVNSSFTDAAADAAAAANVSEISSLKATSTVAERLALVRALHQKNFGVKITNSRSTTATPRIANPIVAVATQHDDLDQQQQKKQVQYPRQHTRSSISNSGNSPITFPRLNTNTNMMFNAYTWSNNAHTATRAASSGYGVGPLSYDTTRNPSISSSSSSSSTGGGGSGSGKPAKKKSKRPNASSTLSWKTVFRAMVGNSVIFVMKFGAWYSTGSGAMFSEAVHTLADCGNQALLLAGLSQASHAPDSRYQYGYGKAAYFWALVSALGMFWTGAGVSIFQGGYHLLHPPEVFAGHEVMLSVLLMSFAVDGYVLVKTLQEIELIKPKDMSLFRYMVNIRDPFLLAVVLEDAAACTGVLLAATGIGMTYATGDVFWDSVASISIGALLAMVALRLARVNQQFLMGQAVDREIINDIRSMIAQRSTIDNVYSVKSQWISPNTFAFKAEVDFNGPRLAQSLHPYYTPLFCSTPDETETKEFLNWFAEDVTTLVELEVQAIEALIQSKYPGAAYVELEPDSKNVKMRSVTSSAFQDPQTIHTMKIITRGNVTTTSTSSDDSDEEDDANDSTAEGGGGGTDSSAKDNSAGTGSEQIMNADDVYKDVQDIDSLGNSGSGGGEGVDVSPPATKIQG